MFLLGRIVFLYGCCWWVDGWWWWWWWWWSGGGSVGLGFSSGRGRPLWLCVPRRRAVGGYGALCAGGGGVCSGGIFELRGWVENGQECE